MINRTVVILFLQMGCRHPLFGLMWKPSPCRSPLKQDNRSIIQYVQYLHKLDWCVFNAMLQFFWIKSTPQLSTFLVVEGFNVDAFADWYSASKFTFYSSSTAHIIEREKLLLWLLYEKIRKALYHQLRYWPVQLRGSRDRKLWPTFAIRWFVRCGSFFQLTRKHSWGKK